MKDFLILLILGAFIIAMGVVNMTGNISTLHKYHRKRVAPENVKPFGRLVGIGTSTCGGGIIIFALLGYVGEKAESTALTVLGTVALIASLAVGLGLSFYAMIKYNRGIF